MVCRSYASRLSLHFARLKLMQAWSHRQKRLHVMVDGDRVGEQVRETPFVLLKGWQR